jgi:hypothetical protein
VRAHIGQGLVDHGLGKGSVMVGAHTVTSGY